MKDKDNKTTHYIPYTGWEKVSGLAVATMTLKGCEKLTTLFADKAANSDYKIAIASGLVIGITGLSLYTGYKTMNWMKKSRLNDKPSI